jgi:hypothetical protein
MKLCNCHLKLYFCCYARQVFTGIALGGITAERRGTLNLNRSVGLGQPVHQIAGSMAGMDRFLPLWDLNDSGHSTNKFH